MSQLQINGINLPVRPEVYNWEQLLQDLESQHLGQGQAISSVHFDGNEILQFRENEFLKRPLRNIQQIKVTAISMEQMTKEATQEAEGYLVSLQTSMASIADAFRYQLTEEANTKLSEALTGIRLFVSLLQGIELYLSGQYQTGSTRVEKDLEEMGPTLESLIEAQNQQDWILVADILEFELLTNLAAFERTLVDFKKRLGLM